MSTPYELIGGDPGVRSVVDRFYDLMDTLPDVAEIRAMHPADLTAAREHLFLFLVGWTGGPPLYVERRGHPRLRARHMPFEIGERARQQWMRCMTQAVTEHVPDPALARQLLDALDRVAAHMRNAVDGAP